MSQTLSKHKKVNNRVTLKVGNVIIYMCLDVIRYSAYFVDRRVGLFI